MQAYSPLGGNDAGSPMKRQLLAEPELAAIAAAHAIDGTPKFCCTPPLHLAGVSIGMERGVQQQKTVLRTAQAVHGRTVPETMIVYQLQVRPLPSGPRACVLFFAL